MATVHTDIIPADFMDSLICFLPSNGKYACIVGAWARTVFTLRERHGEEYPELFKGFHFTTRPPLSPYSKEVSDWFTTLHHVIGAIGGIPYHRVEGLEYIEFTEKFLADQNEKRSERVPVWCITPMVRFAEEIVTEELLAPQCQ